MNETKINQTAELLKVIAHPARLKILLLLSDKGPRNVSSLQDELQLEQSLLSHHLIKLKDKGVLICQRRGKEMHYEVDNVLLEKLIHLLSERIDQEPVAAV